MSDSQRPSWIDTRGYFRGKALSFPEGWLIGQIHFPTAGHELDADDTTVLDALVSEYSPTMLTGQRHRFAFVGHADHRSYSQGGNDQLGLNRAAAVKRYVDSRMQGLTGFVSEAKTRGAQDAKKTKVPDELAADRRVDIFAPQRLRPTIIIPPTLIEGTPPELCAAPLSTKFKFRTLTGAGINIGPVGGQVFTIQVKNSRTGRQATYTYGGAGVGVGFQYNRPTDWEEHEATNAERQPVCMDVDDFEGRGSVTSVAVGQGATVCKWFGPVDRGRTKSPVIITFEGWDFSAQIGTDYFGEWHRRN
jgi:hypothetical protein